MTDLSRRKLFFGLGALISAPAVIRSGILMPIRPLSSDWFLFVYRKTGGFYVTSEKVSDFKRLIGGMTIFSPFKFTDTWNGPQALRSMVAPLVPRIITLDGMDV